MSSAIPSSRMFPPYIHAADYFKAPDLHYDAMSDDEYESVGGSNEMRTEAEVRAIAREFQAGGRDALPALKVRLEQAAIYAAAFEADDPEYADEFCIMQLKGAKFEGPLTCCIDFLRCAFEPPVVDAPKACALCGRT